MLDPEERKKRTFKLKNETLVQNTQILLKPNTKKQNMYTNWGNRNTKAKS